jgi:hypothetical protein
VTRPSGPLRNASLRTRRHVVGLALACAAVAGCSSGDGDGGDAASAEPTAPTMTPSTTASTAPADPDAAVKETALAVYQGFWREMQALYADRDGTTERLEAYAASETLSKARSDAGRAHAQGRIYRGTVTFSQATVTETALDSKTPRVTLSSCLDVSQWQPVDADTGKPVALPADRLTTYLVVTTLEKWPQGWRVVRDEPQGKKC